MPDNYPSASTKNFLRRLEPCQQEPFLPPSCKAFTCDHGVVIAVQPNQDIRLFWITDTAEAIAANQAALKPEDLTIRPLIDPTGLTVASRLNMITLHPNTAMEIKSYELHDQSWLFPNNMETMNAHNQLVTAWQYITAHPNEFPGINIAAYQTQQPLASQAPALSTQGVGALDGKGLLALTGAHLSRL